MTTAVTVSLLGATTHLQWTSSLQPLPPPPPSNESSAAPQRTHTVSIPTCLWNESMVASEYFLFMTQYELIALLKWNNYLCKSDVSPMIYDSTYSIRYVRVKSYRRLNRSFNEYVPDCMLPFIKYFWWCVWAQYMVQEEGRMCRCLRCFVWEGLCALSN